MNRFATLALGMLWAFGTATVSAQEPVLDKSAAKMEIPGVDAITSTTDSKTFPPAKENLSIPNVASKTLPEPGANALPEHKGQLTSSTSAFRAPGIADSSTLVECDEVCDPCVCDPSVCDPVAEGPSFGRFTAGAGIYLLWPRFSSNTAFGRITGNTITYENFDYGAGVAPLVWIAYEGPTGWGARVRWFEFDQAAEPIAFNHPGEDIVIISPRPLGALPVVATDADERVQFGSGLDIDTWDFEITWSPRLGPQWRLLLGLGGTYRYIFQDYSAYSGGETIVPDDCRQITIYTTTSGAAIPWIRSRNPHGGPPGLRNHPHGGPPGLLRKQKGKTAVLTIPVKPGQEIYTGYGLDSARTFNGAGPTFSFDLTRNLGTTGLFAYGEGRFSILFGETSQTVVERAYLQNQVVDQYILTSRTHDVIPVGEIEMGLGLRRELGRSVLLFRTGLVGQAWWGAGNAVSEGGDLGFLGGVFRGGLQF